MGAGSREVTERGSQGVGERSKEKEAREGNRAAAVSQGN